MEEGSLGRSLGQEIPQINNHKKGDAVHQSESQKAGATGKMQIWKRGQRGLTREALGSVWNDENLERSSGIQWLGCSSCPWDLVGPQG